MPLKISPLTWDAPPNGGSAILDYRVMTFEDGALVTSMTVNAATTSVTHSATLERTVLIQARNDQGYSAPLTVELPAVPETGGGGGGGGGTGNEVVGEGLSSGAVPAGALVAPSGITVAPLYGGALIDASNIGSGYTQVQIDVADASIPNDKQTYFYADTNLWPVFQPNLVNGTPYIVTVSIGPVNGGFQLVGEYNVTPSEQSTRSPQIEVAFDAGQNALTVLQAEPGQGTYDQLILGYAKDGDTEATYVYSPTFPLTIPAVAGLNYNFGMYALVRNRVVSYHFVSYQVPGGSQGGEVG